MALTVKVDPGTHTIKITKNGYFPIKFSVNVGAGETKNISKTLIETNRFAIVGHGFPPSAYVGDTISASVQVKNNSSVSDKAKVVVYYDGKTAETTVDLSAGQMKSVWFNISFSSTGTKTITIKTFVYVSEHENGAGWYETDSTTHTITIKEKKATLTITTSPSGAAVYIDGKYVGTT